MKPLNDTNKAVYAFIIAYQRKTGNCPTLQLISEEMNWRSANASYGHIKKLREHGYIAPMDKKHNRIRLPNQRRRVTVDKDARNRVLDKLTQLGQEMGDYDT